jgi:hypothetical protein
MSLPGFTAQVSLYRTSNRYCSLGQGSELQSGVIPQLSIADILGILGLGRDGGGAATAGAAVGAAVGGAVGGPLGAGLGAAVGGTVGRQVGCLVRRGRLCDD